MILIIVEGVIDKCFINSIIEHFKITQNKYEIIASRGWEKIRFLRNNLQQNKDKGGKNYIIFDADDDYHKRRREIINLLDNEDLADEIYLFPDNSGTGNLETLFLTIMNKLHDNVNNCFDKYRECIDLLNKGYLIPDNKTKVFAYLSVLGKEYQPEKINYTDPNIWELDHELIHNLVKFLDDVLNQSLKFQE